jgi:hypothetical protein
VICKTCERDIPAGNLVTSGLRSVDVRPCWAGLFVFVLRAAVLVCLVVFFLYVLVGVLVCLI